MKPIYLYIKTHKITGIKYFGKTTKDNPVNYRGSGVYWRRHISKYGNHVETEILGIFTNIDDCKKFALNFSKENDIVKSEKWANLKEENGSDGSPIGIVFSEKHKKNISKSRMGKCYNSFTPETRSKMSRAASKRSLTNNPFAGERGSLLAKNRNKRLTIEGKHNFQITDMVFVIDKFGKSSRISKNEYRAQLGNKKDWEFVSANSFEAKNRRKKNVI